MRALFLLLVLMGMAEIGWGQCYNDDTSWCLLDTFVKVGKKEVNLKEFKKQHNDSIPPEIYQMCIHCYKRKGFRLDGFSGSFYRSRVFLRNTKRENLTQINFGGVNIGLEFGNNVTVGWGLPFELDWLLRDTISPINNFISDLGHEAFHRGLYGHKFHIGYKIMLHRKFEVEIRSKLLLWHLSPAYKDLIGYDIPMLGAEVFFKRMNRINEDRYYSYDISLSWNRMKLSKFRNDINSTYINNYSMLELKFSFSIYIRQGAESTLFKI